MHPFASEMYSLFALCIAFSALKVKGAAVLISWHKVHRKLQFLQLT